MDKYGSQYWPGPKSVLAAIDQPGLDQNLVSAQLIEGKFPVDVGCYPVKYIGAVIGLDGFIDRLPQIDSNFLVVLNAWVGHCFAPRDGSDR